LGCRLGFDGIDINMGCPDKKVIKAGAGAALINEPERAKEIICAAKDGAGDIPVSVKTRIGFDRDILESWLPRLLEAEPSAATIHARTMKQMSKVPARWDAVRRGAEIARETGIAIIGNGDVGSVAEGKRLAADTGADGVMVGRGALGNYWFFNDNKAEPGPRERLLAVAEHAGLFERNFSGVKNFQMMRKHFHAAASGFPGARELRQNLMRIQNASEAKNLINEFFKGEEVSYN
jgi:tRNA-dihydrouridine synthase